MSDVSIDPVALFDLLNSPDGPVGLVIEELSGKGAMIAKALAPVMKRKRWSELHQYGPPGETRSSVQSAFARFNPAGLIYGGVNVNFGPTLYLESPASQYRGNTQYAFMSQTLRAIQL